MGNVSLTPHVKITEFHLIICSTCVMDLFQKGKEAEHVNLGEQEVYVTGFSRIDVYNVINEAVYDVIQACQPIQVESYQNPSEEEKK